MSAVRVLMACVAAVGLIAAAPAPPPGPLPGTEGASCDGDDPGPMLHITVAGLKDRRGVLRVELYPANDADFLADDTVLLAEGKVFRRVDQPTPADPEPTICIRAPEPGRYAAVVLHDRNGDRKFNAFVDGAGFPNNPKLGLSKPKVRHTSIVIPPGGTSTTIVMNYWNGLSFGPHHHR